MRLTVRAAAVGLLAVGFASGRWIRPDLPRLVRRNASVVGVYAGGASRADDDPDHEALLTQVAGTG